MPIQSFDLETRNLLFQYGGEEGAGLEKNAGGSSFRLYKRYPGGLRTALLRVPLKNEKKRFIGLFHEPNSDFVSVASQNI